MFEEEYQSYDMIPAAVRHLYREADGKYILIKAGEVKTVEDVTRLQESLRKERNDHKETKKQLALFNDQDPEELETKLARLMELEASAGGKVDEEKLNQMVEARIKARMTPVEREKAKIQEALDAAVKENADYKSREVQRTIRDAIRVAATEAKVRDTALEDVLLIGATVFELDEVGKIVTRDGANVPAGLDPKVWLNDMQQTRPHWWPDSAGAGARGSRGGAPGGANPFSADGWNLTEQGRIIRENRALAEQLAKSAGTYIGGQRPKKTT